MLETFQKGPLLSSEIHNDEEIKKVFKKNELMKFYLEAQK